MEASAFVGDDWGGTTSDWLVLTAGIVILGVVIGMSVMENSSGYLMDEFETLNEKYAKDSVTVSELQTAPETQPQSGTTRR